MRRLRLISVSEAVFGSDEYDASIYCDRVTDGVDMLQIAMVTASRQLKVVRAAINWNIPQQDKQVPNQSLQLNPVLQQKAAAVTTWLQHGHDESQLDISSDHISHVEMLPSASPKPNQPWSQPVIVTVRNYVPSPATLPYTPEPQTIINRWELLVDSPPPPVHPAFEQLGFKPVQKNAAGNNVPIQTRLNWLPPVVLPKLVVSVQTVQYGRAVCFMFADGTVQYRDRFTFEEIYNEPDLSRIFSLQSANYQFTDTTPCLAATLSPTNCSLAQLCENGEVKWNGLKYTGPEFAAAGPDGEFARRVAVRRP